MDMDTFLPGDKVEFIDDKTIGTVISILDKNQILIAIEDDLEIPVLKSKLIKISASVDNPTSLQEKYKEDISSQKKIVTDATGLAVAITGDDNKKHINLYLINDSEDLIYFTFYVEEESGIKPITRGQLIPFQHTLLSKETSGKKLGLSRFTICVLFYNDKSQSIHKPLMLTFAPSMQQILQSNPVAPLLNKRALLIPIKQKEPEKKPEKPVFQNKVIQLQDIPKAEKVELEKPDYVVDLHIDKINPDYQIMTRSEILNYQFIFFLNSLEKAIALGYRKIIFIHGIGVSTLKNKITDSLKANSDVGNFGDADLRKYGYGATEVNIKH